MNISILKICGILLFLPLLSFGQNSENYEVLAGESIDVIYNSPIFPVHVVTAPSNGVHALNGVVGATSETGQVTLTYTPDANFIGSDQMVLQMGNNNPIAPQLVEVYVNFTVSPSYVLAKDDYYVLAPGAEVVLDVMDNDEGSGMISMEMVSLVNNTSAVKYGDGVFVKIASDFAGTAKFSYTICDGDMTCDQAVVTIFAESAPNVVDQVSLVTKKETAKRGILPLNNGFQLMVAPDHGTVENYTEGSFDYVPDQGFIGTDAFVIAYNTFGTPSVRTFNMDVLDAQNPNNFAVDDLGHVSIGGAVSVNVLENDLGSNLILQSITEQPINGTASKVNGEIYYEPNPGFSGVDHLKYKVCTELFAQCEITDVYIQVSNDEPSQERYFLTCVKNNALVIEYPSDIPDWGFELLPTTSDEGGSLEYHPGFWSGTVNGLAVEGYNLIVYIPANDFVGPDNFLVSHCVGGDCHQITIKPEVIPGPEGSGQAYCLEECVWPGDANADGVVDILDVLPVGFCTGEVGPERSGPVDKWYGQNGVNWVESGMEGPNEKHVDTDGDGHIMSTDLDPIDVHYNKYHQVTPVGNVNLVDLPLYFVNQTPNPGPGDLVQIDILLGAPATPAVDVTGFTFELNYNTIIVEEGTFNVTFSPDSWLSYDSPVMEMIKKPVIGKLDAGYTRISGTTASGWGKVGSVDFIIEDLIDGSKLPEAQQIEIGAYNPTGMNSSGQYESYSSQPLYIDVNYEQDAANGELNPEHLILYPNPTKELLNVHINGKNNFRRIDLVDITGKMVYQSQASENHLTLDIQGLLDGIYFLRAVTDKGVVTQKFEVYSDK